MNAKPHQSLSELAEVNPRVNIRELDRRAMVSFIPMSDVTESGDWNVHQERTLESVLSGYTAFCDNDILFAKITPCMENGKGAHVSGLTNGVGFGSTEFHVLRAKPGHSSRFLFHVLQDPALRTHAIAFMGGSAGQQRVQAEFFNHYQVPAISQKQQYLIASVLDGLHARITHTKAITSKLKHVRTGLLRDLLTCGLDENGELRNPITNPKQFRNTSLGLLPKEWKISRLGLHATHLTSGSRGWASHYSREGSIFLRIGNLTREHINLRLDDLIRVRPPPGSEGERTRTQPQDILISITADLGIIGVIPDEFPEAFVNQHIALVRPASDMVARWTSRFLAFGPVASHFRLLNDSGAKAGMSLPSVESLLIAIPSLEEQREASRILDELDDSIAREERITEKLIAMKRGLVDDILSGRVRVPQDLELE